MGRKIFISYKYGDTNVPQPPGILGILSPAKVRDYVDKIQSHLDITDHINKGENDGESLSNFKESTIASKLRNKIYDSSITLVLISKGMKDPSLSENDQWIPWEVSYSLKEHSRGGRISSTNAILAVVLPDQLDSYSYFLGDSCPHCRCITFQTQFLFEILRNNMFNAKRLTYMDCNNHGGEKPYHGPHSYICSVRWDSFIADINTYLNVAVQINEKINDYNISKTT